MGGTELRFILRRNEDRPVRIHFADGEVFIVKNIAEVPREDGAETECEVSWSAEIIATENLRPERARLFVKRSGVDFRAEDVHQVVDERTSATLYSKPSDP